jgi:energy-coupling factor transporter ATP-binding protein EcfA2
MHLRRVHLRNVRSIDALTWELPGDADGAGWHVIIGDNGSGKSSLLRSVALALVGPTEAAGLRQDWSEWLRAGCDEASIELTLAGHDPDAFAKGGRPPGAELTVGVGIGRTEGQVQLTRTNAKTDPSRHVWGTGRGWFSASYGPFRRFTGGDKDFEKLFYAQPKLARHLSVFGESVALTEAIEWLQKLQFRALESDPEGRLLEPIRAFVNQPGFLPHGARLEAVTSKSVDFVDGNGVRVPVQSLSDGYRSILSMTFELIRQMALTFGADALFSPDGTQVTPPGVVLVDEIDAHLHPTWQRTVGVWFRQHFPNLQFLVTTHSPLVCQAAEVGTVFRLPRPGVADDRGAMITGVALDRLLYGNVLDAYGTGAFGPGVTRSDSAQEKLDRLARLNTKELMGSLTDEERTERDRLQQILPTEASVTEP